jgi:hypothetical protein
VVTRLFGANSNALENYKALITFTLGQCALSQSLSSATVTLSTPGASLFSTTLWYDSRKLLRSTTCSISRWSSDFVRPNVAVHPSAPSRRVASSDLPGYCAPTFTLMPVGSTQRRSVQVLGFDVPCRLTPTRRLIRFPFVRPALCSQLPPDPTSR